MKEGAGQICFQINLYLAASDLASHFQIQRYFEQFLIDPPSSTRKSLSQNHKEAGISE